MYVNLKLREMVTFIPKTIEILSLVIMRVCEEPRIEVWNFLLTRQALRHLSKSTCSRSTIDRLWFQMISFKILDVFVRETRENGKYFRVAPYYIMHSVLG